MRLCANDLAPVNNHLPPVNNHLPPANNHLPPANNELQKLTVGQAEFSYSYDTNGNMTGEATSRHLVWNHSDQMKAFRVQAGASEASIYALYLYDGAGMRVKKLVRKQGGQIESTAYVDGVFEHHRWHSGMRRARTTTCT